jgi:hypothetical protein
VRVQLPDGGVRELQLPRGACTRDVRAALGELAARGSLTVTVDRTEPHSDVTSRRTFHLCDGEPLCDLAEPDAADGKPSVTLALCEPEE